MEPKLQSSFIPKSPVVTPRVGGTIPGAYRGVKVEVQHSIFGLISVIIFVLSLLAAGGLFGYKEYLISNIANMGNELTQARTTLDPATINTIITFNNREQATEELINNHVIISPVFDYLEKNTLQNVAFTSLELQSTPDQGVQLGLNGVARGYQAVALQSDAFNNNPDFKNISFTNLTLDDKGQVSFSFSATVDPKMLSFAATVGPATSVTPVATTTATSTIAVTTATTTSTSTPAKAATTSTSTTATTTTVATKSKDSCAAGDFDCVVVDAISCTAGSMTSTTKSATVQYKILGSSAKQCHSQIVYISGTNAGQTADCLSSNGDLSTYLQDAKQGTSDTSFTSNSCNLGPT